jgi:hypothetical protein
MLPICTLKQQQGHTELDSKALYEDEAEESDNDFINDGEVDESDSVAAEMATETIHSLRNRQTWNNMQELQCRLCNDMRVVLRHLLGME